MTITITTVTNPIWADAAHTRIICQVTTKEKGGPFGFAATANDPTVHGQQLWKDLNAGKYGTVGAYVAPPTPVVKPTPKSSGTQKV